MTTEVHNITDVTDVIDGHDHAGPSSYTAYIQGCRHPDCKATAAEYRARLKERKETNYIDLRLREHRVNQAMFQIADDPELADRMRELLTPRAIDAGTGPDVAATPVQEPATGRTEPAEGGSEGPEPEAGRTGSDAANQELLDAAMRVLNAVRVCAHPISGVIMPNIYSIKRVALFAQVPEAAAQALVDMLVAIGAIEKRGSDLILTGIEPMLTEAS